MKEVRVRLALVVWAGAYPKVERRRREFRILRSGVRSVVEGMAGIRFCEVALSARHMNPKEFSDSSRCVAGAAIGSYALGLFASSASATLPPACRPACSSTNAARLIETLPNLQRDPIRPEDALKVDGDDDAQGGDDHRRRVAPLSRQ
jgi:hypothetical protein